MDAQGLSGQLHNVDLRENPGGPGLITLSYSR